VSLFATLFVRLAYLQILTQEDYQSRAAANQQRVIFVPAPRGRILDRAGAVLVDNRLSWTMTLDRQRYAALDQAERQALLDALAAELAAYGVVSDRDTLEDRISSPRFSPYLPVPVAFDVPEELAVWITEAADRFQGAIAVEQRPVRTYPYGRLASHLLGYVGPINEDELEAFAGSPLAYRADDEVGKAGVERTFESHLRGRPGRRVLEVDAEGRPVRVLDEIAPTPGNDLVLTLDHQIQALAEVGLREELQAARDRPPPSGSPAVTAPAGSIVLLDPTDGAIRAMASYPDFDPNTFVDGIDQAEWDALTSEGSFDPLVNRAIAGEYPPGSTFKLVTAVAALEAGLIAPETVWRDQGTYRIPNCGGGECVVQNARRTVYGNVDLRRAITVSSDTYFYDLGARFWIERDRLGDGIQAAATTFGFGERTGIELPGERAGWVPTPENKEARHADNPTAFPYGDWYTGDNVNLAIGQGDMLATPIQLASAYGAFANGGQRFIPRVADRTIPFGGDATASEVVTRFEPEPNGQVALDPAWAGALQEGFRGVVQDEEGTAFGSFDAFPAWQVAGKTGTAQVGTRANPRADTALFVAVAPFAPTDQPRYVAAAILEESGYGGVTAARLVRRVLEPIADPLQLPAVTPAEQTP
jgi:penicillin-binding protein 2